MSDQNFEELTDKTLAELSKMFEDFKSAVDAVSRSKDAEAIKSAFYKLLSKMRSEAPEGADGSVLDAVEENFKALYADYKKERAEFNRKQEADREANLEVKKKIIEELKALVADADNVSASFPALREIQNRWREAGPVPATAFRDINEQYQFCVEQFYDKVQIDRDLRDLDFKKNYEAKQALCEAAEKLAENENIVAAFNELQKLHENWKELGPVAKEVREDIWNRFKSATAVVNRKYQDYFEKRKVVLEEALKLKTAMCERMEEIAACEVKNSGEWNSLSKEISEMQEKWRSAGYSKDNNNIYERFRKACDDFFVRKREFYAGVKDNLEENLAKKLEILKEAEALKLSTDWKKATDQFISLQKRWKEVGAVPRKKSEELWNSFRGACDEFFANRDRNANPANDFYGNLKLKKKVLEDIKSYVPGDDETANAEVMREFSERWQAIGHVPFKEKDNIAKAFKDAMQEKFPLFKEAARKASFSKPRPQKSPREQLYDKYRALQQEIATYENNIGFFSMSKNSAALAQQMQQRIVELKAELAGLEEKIRKATEENA